MQGITFRHAPHLMENQRDLLLRNPGLYNEEKRIVLQKPARTGLGITEALRLR